MNVVDMSMVIGGVHAITPAEYLVYPFRNCYLNESNFK